MSGGSGATHPRVAWGMKLHGARSVGVLSYPTAARAAPWGVDGEPPGGRRATQEAISATAAPPRLRQAHDREGVVPLGPCAGKVEVRPVGPRVTCIRADGGKSLRRVGYELPHSVVECLRFHSTYSKTHKFEKPG